ncbi:hypothetical protein IPdc08_01871 [archaeon]|nr:hypothetical protein IPdc08_01871 [archaeon]
MFFLKYHGKLLFHIEICDFQSLVSDKELDITLKTYDFDGIAALLTVAEELQKVRVGLVKVKGTKKAKIVVEQMNPEQANLFSTLKLNRFVPT